MVERSERMWSTGEGKGKALQYSCLEIRMNIMKRQKYQLYSRTSGKHVQVTGRRISATAEDGNKFGETQPSWEATHTPV